MKRKSREKQNLIVRLSFYGMFLLPSALLYFLMGMFSSTTKNTGIDFSQAEIVIFYFILSFLCFISVIIIFVYLRILSHSQNARIIKIYSVKKNNKYFYLSFLSFTPSLTNFFIPSHIQIWFLLFFYIVGGIFYISSEIITFQPLLFLFSFSFYNVEYRFVDDGEQGRVRSTELIIRNSDLQEGDQISFKQVTTNTIFGFNCKESYE